MQLLRFRIRSIMIGIASLALLLTWMGQTILPPRPAAREQRLRAEIEANLSGPKDRAGGCRFTGHAAAIEPVSDPPEPEWKPWRPIEPDAYTAK